MSEANEQQALEAPDATFANAFAERAGGEAKPLDGPAPSEPEPASAGSTDAPAPAAAEGSASGEAKPFDPWVGLMPEQKSYFERVSNSERSQRGRVGALTKKLNGLESQRAAPAPQQQEEPEGRSADESDDLAKSVEEYGDVVGPLAKRYEALQAQIDAIGRPATAKAEVDADAEAITEALGTLEREHPDYAQIAADTSFQQWMSAQPEKVQGLANSYDPVEVSLVLTKFKMERSAAIASQSGNSGDQGRQEGSATDDRRQRQLEGSKAVTNRGAPAAAGVPNDFSSAFKARAAATSP